MNIKGPVTQFALIAFIILVILFGMNIMVFIFGNMSATSIVTENKISLRVDNESGAWLNSSKGGGYYLSQYNKPGFSNPAILYVNNVTGLINSGNYSVSSNGLLINSTATTLANVNVTYTYQRDSANKVVMDNINNGSLQAIQTYSRGASTQMNVLSISLILVLLLGVFGFFWAFFMGAKGKQNQNSGGNFT